MRIIIPSTTIIIIRLYIEYDCVYAHPVLAVSLQARPRVLQQTLLSVVAGVAYTFPLNVKICRASFDDAVYRHMQLHCCIYVMYTLYTVVYTVMHMYTVMVHSDVYLCDAYVHCDVHSDVHVYVVVYLYIMIYTSVVFYKTLKELIISSTDKLFLRFNILITCSL